MWSLAPSSPARSRPHSAVFVFLPRGEHRPRFARQTAAPRQYCKRKRDRYSASPESNQIFHHATIIAADAEIAEHHKLIVDLETRYRLLLAGSRIDRANIQIQTIEH